MTSKEEKHSVDDLQSMLGESINQIMKLYFSEKTKSGHATTECQVSPKTPTLSKLSNSSTLGKINKGKAVCNSRNMINLLFGEKKFLWVISQVFYYGFKNRRSFRKQTFLWDYLLRVQCELKHISPSSMSAADRLSSKQLITLIDQITDQASNYGKEMKFQLFILISLR